MTLRVYIHDRRAVDLLAHQLVASMLQHTASHLRHVTNDAIGIGAYRDIYSASLRTSSHIDVNRNYYQGIRAMSHYMKMALWHNCRNS